MGCVWWSGWGQLTFAWKTTLGSCRLKAWSRRGYRPFNGSSRTYGVPRRPGLRSRLSSCSRWSWWGLHKPEKPGPGGKQAIGKMRLLEHVPRSAFVDVSMRGVRNREWSSPRFYPWTCLPLFSGRSSGCMCLCPDMEKHSVGPMSSLSPNLAKF